MIGDRSFGTDDRGVSELVGFVIIFGIIIGSVGFLYMTGFQAMGDYQDYEQTKNAERAMDALAENFNDIVRSDGVQYRAGEINLRQGTIQAVSDEPTITVYDDSGKKIMSASGSFVYETDDATIAYEGGAVIRTSGGGHWTVKEPPIRCGSDVAIISLVAIDNDGPAVTSQGTREISAIQVSTKAETVSGDVVIQITSPRRAAWGQTLTEAGWSDDGSGQYTCTTNDAVVRKTTIDVQYD